MTREEIVRKLEELYGENAEVKVREQKPPYLKTSRDIWINGDLINFNQVEWFIADENAIWNVSGLDEIEEETQYLVSVHWNRDNEIISQNWLVITFWDIGKEV